MSECKWKHWNFENDSYQTECNEIFEFTEGDIYDNNFLYCPFCGRPLIDDENSNN